MPTIAEIKEQYPGYAKYTDDSLAQALHKKFYSNYTYESFAKQVGVKPFPDMEVYSPPKDEDLSFQGSTTSPPLAPSTPAPEVDSITGAAQAVQPSQADDINLQPFSPQKTESFGFISDPSAGFDPKKPEVDLGPSFQKEVTQATILDAIRLVGNFGLALPTIATKLLLAPIIGPPGAGEGTYAERVSMWMDAVDEVIASNEGLAPQSVGGKQLLGYAQKGLGIIFKPSEWQADKAFPPDQFPNANKIAKEIYIGIQSMLMGAVVNATTGKVKSFFKGKAKVNVKQTVQKGKQALQQLDNLEKQVKVKGDIATSEKTFFSDEIRKGFGETKPDISLEITAKKPIEVSGKTGQFLKEINEVRGELAAFKAVPKETPPAEPTGPKQLETTKRPTAPAQERTINKNRVVFTQMLDEVESATAGKRLFNEEGTEVIGEAESTFPEWFKESELTTKKAAVNILKKAKEGEPLTELQLDQLDEILELKRDSMIDPAHTEKIAKREKRVTSEEAEKIFEGFEGEAEGFEGEAIEKGAQAEIKSEQGSKAGFAEAEAEAASKNILFKKKSTKKQKGDEGTLFEEKEATLFDEGGYADKGDYDKDVKPSAIELPEILSIAKDLMEGKLPKVMGKIRALGGKALGVFKAGKGDIGIKASTFKEPGVAEKVLAHEIGHLADWLPDKDPRMARGNVLGRIASLPKYLKSLLEEYPDAPGKVLTPRDRIRLRKQAKKMAANEQSVKKGTVTVSPDEILAIWKDTAAREKDPGMYDYVARLSREQKSELMKSAMKKIVPDWFGFKKGGYTTALPNIKEIYQKLLREEILKRRLIDRNVIMQELKDLTQKWKPFNEGQDPKFTKYRHSPEELYADAVSVLFNDPELLKRTAPEFQKAFFNYLERKPEVKNAYEAIQELQKAGPEAIGEKRHKETREMFQAGEELEVKLQKEKEAARTTVAELIEREYIDSAQPINKRLRFLKKKGVKIRPEDNPAYAYEKLPYAVGEIMNHNRNVERTILDVAKKAGITVEDIAEIQMLQRTGGERAGIANPKGFGKKTSTDQLAFLKKKWGEVKYDHVVEMTNDFARLRQEDVIPVIEKAQQYNAETMQHLKDNNNYVTFQVQKFLEEKYGKEVANLIHRQIGTLQDIKQPFVATMIKDATLIRSANIKMITEKGVKFLQKHFPTEIMEADRVWDANKKYRRPVPPPDQAKQGMVAYLDNGEVKAYYVPKDMADMYKYAPEEMGVFLNILDKVTGPLKSLLVGKNIPWAFHNFQRDVRAFLKQLPEANIFDAIRHLQEATPEALMDVFEKKSSADVATMYKEGMLPIDRYFRSIEDSPDMQMDREFMKYGSSESAYKTNVLLPWREFSEALEKPGKFTERVIKIASYKYMKKKFPKMSPEEIAHIVRTRGGTPDLLGGGTRKRAANIVFLFSNAGIRGATAALESAKENPARYATKTALYDIAPKVIMFLAASGALGVGLKAMMDRVPEYDKTNYNVIPLAMTESEEVVYLIAPGDFQGQVIGGLAWKLMNKDLRGAIDYVAGGMPYSSVNPFISLGVDLLQYSFGKNPYNEHRGTEVVPPQIFEAGGWRSHKEILKHAWNMLGGGVIHRLKGGDIEPVRSQLEKMLDIPVTSAFARKFLRVTQWGKREQLRDSTGKIRKTNALTLIQAREAMVKMVLKDKAYKDLSEAEKTALVLKKDNVERYLAKMMVKKTGNAYQKEMLNARTVEEKMAIWKQWKKDQAGIKAAKKYSPFKVIVNMFRALTGKPYQVEMPADKAIPMAETDLEKWEAIQKGNSK